jgi:hypothetical protein
VRDPVLKDFSANTNQQFQFTLQSAPGRYEVLFRVGLESATSNWFSMGTITNLTGTAIITATNLRDRFFQVRTAP